MKVKELAHVLKISLRAASYLVNGHRFLNREKAIEAERRTGIDRVAWVFPERSPNPHLKKASDS